PLDEENIMADEQAKKPDLKVVTEEELDEEEKEFRALRRDVPGVQGAAAAGILTIGVGKQPSPKNVFFRTHPTFTPVVRLVTAEVGMDHHFIAVMPNMVEPLASMGITAADHTIYLTITEDGALRVIPVRCADADGVQNEWDRTKEEALIKAMDAWYRLYTDMAQKAFKTFPAPVGRYGEPNWPDIKPAKIIRLAFKDKGRLIDSIDHILVQKWAGRDRD